MTDDLVSQLAREAFGLSGLLETNWRRLAASDRDRLLSDLTATTVRLRGVLQTPNSDRQQPTAEDIDRELRDPQAQVFLQPVVRLPSCHVVGFEALTRFPWSTPDRWFQQAWQCGVGLEFELAAVRRALHRLAELPSDVYLAINVSPISLISPELAALTATSDPDRIILELTEHEPISEYELYRSYLAALRQTGPRVAVDDAGAGYSSLRHIIQLEPDIIKLDRGITSHCHDDPVRQALITSLATFTEQTHISLVAEGIETADEAAALVSFGVAFGQGYFFGPPQPDPTLVVSAQNGDDDSASRAHPTR